jgi:kynureninase
VSIGHVRKASTELAELFIAGVETDCPELRLASPRDAVHRGSQVSFRHEQGLAIMQALIARGVIGDFRAPDTIRFGFTPLYLGRQEVLDAIAILAEIMASRAWNRPEFRRKALVT